MSWEDVVARATDTGDAAARKAADTEPSVRAQIQLSAAAALGALRVSMARTEFLLELTREAREDGAVPESSVRFWQTFAKLLRTTELLTETVVAETMRDERDTNVTAPGVANVARAASAAFGEPLELRVARRLYAAERERDPDLPPEAVQRELFEQTLKEYPDSNFAEYLGGCFMGPDAAARFRAAVEAERTRQE